MQHVVKAVSPDLHVYQFDGPYVVWYERITRRCISRIGAGIDGATHCFKTLNRLEDAVADAQAEVLDAESEDDDDKDEDDDIYLNVDEQIVTRETVGGKVTQAATTATPMAGQRRSTHHRPHSCLAFNVTTDHQMLDARYIANMIMSTVEADPSTKVKAQAMVKDKCDGYYPSYAKTWAAKQIAIAAITVIGKNHSRNSLNT
ncbi:hypothetical protein RHMOL_Rhmol10G0189000 [Rhododendron molle]|nr:hypothetical protein RHMOL_Rhmol10G0189000 [Rhododendron molle]